MKAFRLNVANTLEKVVLLLPLLIVLGFVAHGHLARPLFASQNDTSNSIGDEVSRDLWASRPIVPALQGVRRLSQISPIPTPTDCDVPDATYATIQDAVNDPSCSTINLVNALYVENVIINRSVTIQGQGMSSTTVDGNASGSVFAIQPGLQVTLTDMTITNGAAADGGGINNGVGSTLIADSIAVVSNSASSRGGGIFNEKLPTGEGTIHFTNSTLSDNSANNNGGGIYSKGNLIVDNTTFTGNTATEGGGIYNNGTMQVSGSTINGNTANGEAGGIINFGSLEVANSTVSGNSASYGGGIFNNGGQLTVTNSTVGGNSATDSGGGIYVDGQTTVEFSTLASNSAASGDSIFIDGLSPATLVGSIVAHSTNGGACAGPFLNSMITSLGHNLDSDGTCNLTAPGDQPNTDPLLGPLTDNGGPTLTHALLSGSPAVDAVPVADCADTGGNPLTADQRGVARPQGPACDIGAYERQAAVPVYVSSSSSGTAGGVDFKDEDILAYDPGSGDWSMFFDGSDVDAGSEDLNGFLLLDDGSILMTFDDPFDLNGVGDIDDSDIVRFFPTSTGTNTAGSFTLFFDGSDVGLSSSDEDIDSIGVTPDGRLVISTNGDFSASGVSGRDEDLFVFDATSFGEATAGSFARYFDGSDVDLRSTDLEGTWIDGGTGEIYLTVNEDFSVPGVSGDRSDIFICEPGSLGSDTSCAFTPFWDGSANDFEGEKTDGVSIGDRASIDGPGAGPQVDLVVSKTESADPVVAGSGSGNLVYVVTVANNGPSDATGVELSEVLTFPSGVSVDSITPSQGTFSDPTWSVGSLADGASATLTIVLTVGDPGPYPGPGNDVVSDTAKVVAANETLINTGDDSATESTSITAASGGGDKILFVSSSSSGSAGDIDFKDEDILAYDTTNGTWSMVFDGSDVDAGSEDLTGFSLLGDGSVLMSFDDPFDLNGVGPVDDSDIVRFIPSSTGPNTAGTFELYFDGSDVGLSDSDEDVDAIHLLANGDLLLSTTGSFSVDGLSGKDEDLIRFTPTSLGANTSGNFSLYFDGSDVDMTSSDEDVRGAWIDEKSGEVYLTTKDDFSVNGVSGDRSDIFICDPGSLGSDTSCSFSLFWDGSANGFDDERTDGIAIKTLPPCLGTTCPAWLRASPSVGTLGITAGLLGIGLMLGLVMVGPRPRPVPTRRE